MHQLPMTLHGSIWLHMTPYVSLWLSMAPYSSLWFPIAPYDTHIAPYGFKIIESFGHNLNYASDQKTSLTKVYPPSIFLNTSTPNENFNNKNERFKSPKLCSTHATSAKILCLFLFCVLLNSWTWLDKQKDISYYLYRQHRGLIK